MLSRSDFKISAYLPIFITHFTLACTGASQQSCERGPTPHPVYQCGSDAQARLKVCLHYRIDPGTAPGHVNPSLPRPPLNGQSLAIGICVPTSTLALQVPGGIVQRS